MRLFSKVLVANRGEIAIRIFRTLRELGIAAVAVYSEADRAALHVRSADEAFLIGPGAPSESYLSQERILAAARAAGAEAIHPGYGFLAENAEFARAVEAAGLVWIGPPPEAIAAMGSKTEARERMAAAGVPIIPGTTEPVRSADEVARLGDELGWPLAIKASAGGGGKGFRVVRRGDDVARAFESAQREGEAYFSDPTVYVERYLEDPRHVEVQVLADAQGNVVHLGERDCTIQRRHQKLVEETPSPAVDAELRARIGAIAVEAARAVGYRSAGTIEGLLDLDGSYYFMEMNTRIQVEHTVTEMVTGLDLVREQVLIAAGEPLSLRQEDVRLVGHAIECRINAEDPSNGFLPAPGRITGYREPSGPGVRVDSGVEAGSEISPLYDPMVAKLIVHGVDRDHARRRMLRALDEFQVGGVTTLLGFHRALLGHPCFVEGGTCHGVVESEQLAQLAERLTEEADRLPHQTTTVAAGSDGRLRERVTVVELDGRRFDVTALTPAPPWAELAARRRERADRRTTGAGGRDAIVSPMQGTVLAVQVADGETVTAGQVICVVEAMKMENEVHAPRAGLVQELSVAVGQPVSTGQVICVVAPEADAGG
ncbi:MAG TPA: acetyl-CoA carboxylase biotin carboxylase subunit [Gaiellaceae bacterium]|nr:acetyl-CoA carboxylase biotin carboxylase subunit [Gaiellaceae bacterium]